MQNPRPDWWVKIADFGSSKRAIEGHTETATLLVGTPGFLSPEAQNMFCPVDVENGFNERSYTPAVDMWALGEITHRMITARPVFRDSMELCRYVDRRLPFPMASLDSRSASNDCRNFIESTMAPSSRHRLTSQAALSHAWLAGYSSPSDESSAPSAK